jgi:hypothetical protein
VDDVAGPGAPTQPNPQPLDWRTAGRVVARGLPRIARPRRQPRLPGRLPNERIVWVRHQSRLYLLASGAPLLLGTLGLLLLHLWLGDNQGIVQLLATALLVILTIRWLLTDFWKWCFTYLILTNERVIKSSGSFNRTTEELPLKSVAQVLVERSNPLVMALGIGDLQVRPIGSPIVILGMAHPRDLADSILAMQENPQYGLPPTAAPAAGAASAAPKLQSKKLQDALEELAKPAPMPAPPPVSARTFATFLQRRIPIKFIEGEQVVQVVYRHWVILLKNELIALAIFIGGFVLGVVLLRGGFRGTLPDLLIIGGLTVGGLIGYLTYLNWADDVFVLTTHRVIDVDRLIFILSEYSNDAPYARIQNVSVARNWLGLMLGYGSIKVETSGRKNPVSMENIPHAGRVMDRIFAQINQLREREAVAALNRQKKENYTWLSTLFHEAIARVPDVRGLTLLDAAGAVRRAGLKMVVLAERHVPGTPSGLVLEQEPSADTSELAEGEVRVVLSGQPVPATRGP